MGYLITGSDIGGYREDKTYPTSRSKELFIRWAQLGAFCPLMENGGGGEHRPWMFDDETNDIYRELVLLHHKLIPYLDYTARASFDVKKSVMQFVRKADYSYLLGSDIFVTPIRRAGNNPIEIRFPQGKDTWIYIYDASKEFKGGTSTVMNFEIDEFPAFVKKGFSPVIPEVDFASRYPQSDFPDDLGDYDIIAIIQSKKEIWLIESKFLQKVGSIYEDQMQQKSLFYQNKYDEKFQRRIDYISNNLNKVRSVFNLEDSKYAIISYMVTNKLLASRYKKLDFPIISYHELIQKLDDY